MKFLSKIATASALLLVAGGAAAQTTSPMLGSQHDLATRAGASTSEICVFCHTPHGSDIGAPVPLWNKTLPAGNGYLTYADLATSTLDGSEHTEVGSVSLACLSCHDGAQAVDAVINAPGRGPGLTGNLGSGLTIGALPAPNNPLALIGGATNNDLRDDHPISIQYGGGGVNENTHPASPTPTPFPGTLGDPDFRAPVRATINARPAWWVDSNAGTALVREKTDMILYTRTDTNLDGNAAQPFVECGSCHDPHNATTFQENVSVSFLRIPNDNSDICTTCHTK